MDPERADRLKRGTWCAPCSGHSGQAALEVEPTWNSKL